MQCDDLAERLTDLMEGDLTENDEVAALEHLASCAQCEAVLSETREVVELAKGHGRPELSDDDRSRMLSSLIDGVDASASD